MEEKRFEHAATAVTDLDEEHETAVSSRHTMQQKHWGSLMDFIGGENHNNYT